MGHSIKIHGVPGILRNLPDFSVIYEMSVKLLGRGHIEHLPEGLEGDEVMFVQVLKALIIIRVSFAVKGFFLSFGDNRHVKTLNFGGQVHLHHCFAPEPCKQRLHHQTPQTVPVGSVRFFRGFPVAHFEFSLLKTYII
ncbi:Uncharacterized protein dnm_050680 [Desulfonema magnum]|uniref:Uncharacterized protein n=1 Tax=Desulfonema magnum TaxID=45655 RepID=A0A975GPH7_9BACT|nr:Uncharacterized protein dnm_050680 [Desulfonema magnum]